MTQRISLSPDANALIDDADYERLRTVPWFCNANGYAVGFVKTAGQFHLVYMHRYLLSAPDGYQVDHIDGNRLNNTRSNLRLVTPHQNRLNKRVSTCSSTKLKGVHWHARRNKYEARIQYQGLRCHLGYFDELEQAALAYDEAARRLFGDYGWQNYPEKRTPRREALLVAEKLRKHGLIK